MPDVSVIIIAHDVRDEVIAALGSVREHAGPVTVEAIVVDNGSRDGTAGAVAANFPEARVIVLPRNEGGSARNHGLRVARGRHLMFLDSDALLTAGALEDLVAFLDERPWVGLVGPALVYPDGTPQPSARRLPPRTIAFLRRPPLSRIFEHRRAVSRHLMRDVTAAGTREAEYVIGACQLFSRAAQQAVGELDPRIPFAPEDIDWCLRIRAVGFRIAYRPEARVIHAYRRATASRPLSRAAAVHLYGFAYFLWKWRGEWRRLREEGAAMERRGWELSRPNSEAPSSAPTAGP